MYKSKAQGQLKLTSGFINVSYKEIQTYKNKACSTIIMYNFNSNIATPKTTYTGTLIQIFIRHV